MTLFSISKRIPRFLCGAGVLESITELLALHRDESEYSIFAVNYYFIEIMQRIERTWGNLTRRFAYSTVR